MRARDTATPAQLERLAHFGAELAPLRAGLRAFAATGATVDALREYAVDRLNDLADADLGGDLYCARVGRDRLAAGDHDAAAAVALRKYSHAAAVPGAEWALVDDALAAALGRAPSALCP